MLLVRLLKINSFRQDIASHLIFVCNPFLPPVAQFTKQHALLKAMVQDSLSWADEQEIRINMRQLPSRPWTSVNKLQTALLAIFKQLDEGGRHVFILIDEIQRFFNDDVSERLRLGYCSPADFFKDLVSLSQRRNRVAVAVTGSSLVQAWMSFSEAAPNDHTLAGARRMLTIPVNTNLAVADMTVMQLRRLYPEVTLPDELFMTLYRDPAWLCFLAETYRGTRSVSKAQTQAVQKVVAEFAADVDALASALAKQPELVLELRSMAGKGSNVDPATWWAKWGFKASVLHDDFLQDFITESSKGVWTLVPCIYGQLLSDSIEADGTLAQDIMSRSAFIDGFFFEPVLNDLADLSNQLKAEGEIAQSTGPKICMAAAKRLAELRRVFDEEADKEGWLSDAQSALNDPAFKYALNHKANHVSINGSKSAAESTLKGLREGRGKQWVRKQNLNGVAMRARLRSQTPSQGSGWPQVAQRSPVVQQMPGIKPRPLGHECLKDKQWGAGNLEGSIHGYPGMTVLHAADRAHATHAHVGGAAAVAVEDHQPLIPVVCGCLKGADAVRQVGVAHTIPVAVLLAAWLSALTTPRAADGGESLQHHDDECTARKLPHHRLGGNERTAARQSSSSQKDKHWNTDMHRSRRQGKMAPGEQGEQAQDESSKLNEVSIHSAAGHLHRLSRFKRLDHQKLEHLPAQRRMCGQLLQSIEDLRQALQAFLDDGFQHQPGNTSRGESELEVSKLRVVFVGLNVNCPEGLLRDAFKRQGADDLPQ
ncbi:hypothetical protein JKP88DRAFT_304948 [Tribonema minus]|uniref:Uncharacterized protein n=1 Tax=Tribonema minus TaxID=303371 RepID=A0A835Z7A6_9STRA|nr:hypothetical protein JKP88DRAFT_304948 [Tribonema minus]